MSDDNALKVVLLGEAGVGKTNLIRVSIGKEFEHNAASTLASTYCVSKVQIGNKSYKYYLWDTAGQESYRSLNKLFIKDSKIVLIVFAINARESFNEVDFWYQNVKEQLGDDGYFVGLVGNKSDLYEEENVVKDEEIEKKANELGVKFKVTSALTDSDGFKQFLNKLLEEYIHKYIIDGFRSSSFRIAPAQKKNTKDGKKCC